MDRDANYWRRRNGAKLPEELSAPSVPAPEPTPEPEPTAEPPAPAPEPEPEPTPEPPAPEPPAPEPSDGPDLGIERAGDLG